jgi:pyruvate/2-oxoglutarate dehydrogenase complex dihydrolipoamide acyltransferase (E2) component
MATQIVMPRYGHTMTQGEIVEWLVAPGDKIEKGAPLCEIASEKITNILESTIAGTVKALLFEEGEKVNVGEPIIEID